MASETFYDRYRKGYISSLDLGNAQSGQGFDADSAFGANMVNRSNLQNPNPSRDTMNALIGAAQNQNGNAFGGSQAIGNVTGAFGGLFDPEKLKTAFTDAGIGMGINLGSSLLGRLIGGNTGAAVGNAAGSVGTAAAQGFANPVSDAGAALSLVNLFRRFF